MSFWEADHELADSDRLAESRISVNRQVTDKVTELEEISNLSSDFLSKSLMSKASVNGVFPNFHGC